MAWIKIDHTTPDKPEIVAMAAALKMDQDAVFGKCVRIWIWADQQMIDGCDLPVTPAFLDRLTNCPGFADCLVSVGWLRSRNDRISVPHFDRHNGQTAKNRALTAGRTKRFRNGQNVTQSSPDKRKNISPIVPLDGKEAFETFRQAYPGTRRGAAVEWEYFKSRYQDRIAEILPRLLPAAKAYAAQCAREGTEQKYRKHLKTWINQECWTVESAADAPRALDRVALPSDDFLPDALQVNATGPEYDAPEDGEDD